MSFLLLLASGRDSTTFGVGALLAARQSQRQAQLLQTGCRSGKRSSYKPAVAAASAAPTNRLSQRQEQLLLCDDDRVFSVILYEPEIPPNTGNIIRLCANTGVALHLIEPLGFDLDDKKLRRAGLDYREFADVATHASLEGCLDALGKPRVFALSTRGTTRHDEPSYHEDDVFLFGPETRGLPGDVLDALPAERRLRLPMRESSRSLNLSNSAAIVVYEAWRQLGFAGGA